ncbi:MAG TPA: hypothetical protein PLP83_03895 [Candidatus Aminicenantes bacterium]|nr:hypothetical protein [Candidatus Aminicenantes bacterium]
MLVSLSDKDKKWVEAESRRRKVSGAEVVRLCLRELRRRTEGEDRRLGLARIAEKNSEYGHDPFAGIVDKKELWARAVAAAGRFSSGLPNLSIEHDRYAWGEPGDAGDAENETAGQSGAQGGSGAGPGARNRRRERQDGKGKAR